MTIPANGGTPDGQPVGVLLMAYGTPATPDDVEAYYTHVRRGRPPTAEQLADLRRRYHAIGGTSPLRERTEAQAAGLQAALGGGFRVQLGMKHSSPFVEDGVAALAAAGVRRAVGLVLAPHYSALSVGEYVERARRAARFPYAGARSRVDMTFVESWHLAPGYLDLLAGFVGEARARLGSRPASRSEGRSGPASRSEGRSGPASRSEGRSGPGVEPVHVLFTAHSLPARILETGDPYPGQLRETAEAVAGRAGLDRWSVGWQSAGRTPEPWIGPDLLTVLGDLQATGVRGVVVCAAGFVSDHLEILYDLDVEAAKVAGDLGLAFTRTESPNDHPAFCAALADVVRRHVAG